MEKKLTYTSYNEEKIQASISHESCLGHESFCYYGTSTGHRRRLSKDNCGMYLICGMTALDAIPDTQEYNHQHASSSTKHCVIITYLIIIT